MKHKISEAAVTEFSFRTIERKDSSEPSRNAQLERTTSFARDVGSLIIRNVLNIREESEPDRPLLTITSHVKFELVDDNEQPLATDEIISKEWLIAFASIAYSTSRGLFLPYFKLSPWPQFLLPMVDPSNLMPSSEEGTQSLMQVPKKSE